MRVLKTRLTKREGTDIANHLKEKGGIATASRQFFTKLNTGCAALTRQTIDFETSGLGLVFGFADSSQSFCIQF